MNWSDEHYVKLYTRETPNWSMLPWQSRLLLPAILKKADKAGLIDLGKDHGRALGAFLGVPIDFIDLGLPALLESGTCELRNGVLITPKFVEAQEARKTKIAASREFRDRARDEARAGKRLILLERPESPRVTPEPSCPTPTPARPLPEKPAGEKPPARNRKPKKEIPPDPRHAPLVAALATTFEAERGSPLAFDGYQARAVTQLLALAEPAEIQARYRRALRHNGFPTVATPAELRKNWDHFATDAPLPRGAADPNGGIIRHVPGYVPPPRRTPPPDIPPEMEIPL